MKMRKRKYSKYPTYRGQRLSWVANFRAMYRQRISQLAGKQRQPRP